MTKHKELHNGAFHFVFAVPNQQWWITYGHAGPGGLSKVKRTHGGSTLTWTVQEPAWSIVSRHNSYAEGLKAWHVLFPKKPK